MFSISDVIYIWAEAVWIVFWIVVGMVVTVETAIVVAIAINE